ncbi:MAG: peptide MFS transporter [Bacteroidia bacterium]
MTTEVKKGHPKGLFVLFATEMWERFNFYGMRALLTLFIINALMISQEKSSIIYGEFLGLCYLTPMLGGFISDRFLGNRYCIMLGGILMAIGQFLLFTSATIFSSNLEFARTLLYIALGVIILGNGFFKPNISSMVGSLYPKAEKNKLDSAFTIFYMGINVGAILGQFICPFIGDHKVNGIQDPYIFKWGFLAAGTAMLLGTLTFILLKNKYVVTPEGRAIGDLPSKNTHSDFAEGESQKAKFSNNSLIAAVLAFCALGAVFFYVLGQPPIYCIIYSSGLTLAGLILSDSSLTKVERQQIWVIYIVSFFIIFFWAAFEQAGTSLTFIASNQTDRHILGWDMPASMVQIFNGLFVVILALPFSLLWDKLRARNREPISPMKQAFGLLLIAISYFIIANNVKDLGNSTLLNVKWLALLYFIMTLGELSLSPIGLSLVGKLAPKRFASLLFGVFFLSNASGYALSGTLGSILPPTSEQYTAAVKINLDLPGILDGKVTPSGKDLFELLKIKSAKVNEELAKANNFDFTKILKNEKAELTPEQYTLIKDKKILTTGYPVFCGFTLHNLYEFFMVFVVMCVVASILLFSLTPLLKKMMHGVR